MEKILIFGQKDVLCHGYWWMFHFTSEKGRIFEGIVYSWVKLKQVESHARVGLKSLSGGPKLSYVIRTTYEKHGQS